MSPNDHISILEYATLDIDIQVRLQMALARRYAEPYYDGVYSERQLKDMIEYDMLNDLYAHEQSEKYEYCMLYKDTIENLEYIPVRKLY